MAAAVLLTAVPSPPAAPGFVLCFVDSAHAEHPAVAAAAALLMANPAAVAQQKRLAAAAGAFPVVLMVTVCVAAAVTAELALQPTKAGDARRVTAGGPQKLQQLPAYSTTKQ